MYRNHRVCRYTSLGMIPALHVDQLLTSSLCRLAFSRASSTKIPREYRGGSDDRWLYINTRFSQGPFVKVGAAAGRNDRDSGNGKSFVSHLLLGTNTAFAVLLTSGTTRRRAPAPSFHYHHPRRGAGQDWPAVAAGTTLFLVPNRSLFTVAFCASIAACAASTFGAVPQMKSRSELDAAPRAFTERIFAVAGSGWRPSRTGDHSHRRRHG